MPDSEQDAEQVEIAPGADLTPVVHQAEAHLVVVGE